MSGEQSLLYRELRLINYLKNYISRLQILQALRRADSSFGESYDMSKIIRSLITFETEQYIAPIFENRSAFRLFMIIYQQPKLFTVDDNKKTKKILVAWLIRNFLRRVINFRHVTPNTE